MFICKISIVIILICRKLGSVGPVQQKIKLPSSETLIKYFHLKKNWVHYFSQHSTMLQK